MDLDTILDSLPDHQFEDVPLNNILAIPGMSPDTALPYHMYLTYNPRLPEDRKEKVRQIIDRIRFNHDYINKYNLQYLERDFRVEQLEDPSFVKIETQYKEET